MGEILGKFFIWIGAFLILIGFIFVFLSRLRFPSLPLDFHLRFGNVEVYLPLGTSLLLSILLTLLLNIILWLALWLTKG
ncbi:MAG: DUF2905 family protein [Thermotogae bacterium]|nr:DUF2905 family protein [Thermotogota bacterium]